MFWDAGDAMMKKALGMLQFPLQEQETKDGKTTIKPGKWTVKDAASLMRVAKELMCIASDIASDKMDIHHKLPDELKRIAKKYGVELEEVESTWNEVHKDVLEAMEGKEEKPN